MRTSLVGVVVAAAAASLLGLWACQNSPAPGGAVNAPKPGPELSPMALAASADGKNLYVACATGFRVLTVDVAGGKVVGNGVVVPGPARGLALTTDGGQLWVACSNPANSVSVIDTARGRITQTIPTGAGTSAVTLNPQKPLAYACATFLNEVEVIDRAAGKVVAKIPTLREPVAAAVTPNGATLVVANHLPAGAANAEVVAAAVQLVDTNSNQVTATITLPNGSTSCKGVAISPDGAYACVTHVLARFNVPTTQLERGWMNTNALSIIDLANKKLLNTVLLDDVDSGAANPWGVAFSADGKTLAVTHAGSQELSLVNLPGVIEKLGKAQAPADVPNDLAFLVDLRQRIKLPGNGPRSVAFVGGKVYVGEYFTDTLSVVNPEDRSTASLALGPKPTPSVARKGEMFFHDASLCFQTWQSCSTCHPGEARVDALNWDLLNDGIGNPKNTRSMLYAHKRAPVMSLGVRDTAEVAVRSGIRYIQFAVRPEEDAAAIDEYLKSLTPEPSPLLVNGRFSPAAARGQKLFNDPTVGCANCHSGELYTNLKRFDVGTRGDYDKTEDLFITPTLVELWRTAPYLHDGSAATVQDVLTTHNKQDRHGKTSQLSKEQIEDLAAYLLSL